MQRFLLVCLGGALGSGARYLISLLAVRLFGLGFPLGTLAVNLIGCFLITAIVTYGAPDDLLSPVLRLFLTTGIMGGLTTYSAYNHELLRFFEDGAYGRAASYLFATLLGCLTMGLLGLYVGRWLRMPGL
jgi:CrcB protein